MSTEQQRHDPAFDEDAAADAYDDLAEYPESRPPFRDGRVHVLRERCSTCVFRAGNLMHLAPGRLRDLVESSREADTAFSCHQTLPYAPGGGDMAICRGYHDAYGDEITPLRMATAFGIIAEVDPPQHH